MMTSSREYIEIKTLGSNASQRLSLSDCSFMFNVILPPPLKINSFFTKGGNSHTAWRCVPYSVPALLCTITSN